MKKLIFIFLFVFGLLVLSACGKQSGAESDGSIVLTTANITQESSELSLVLKEIGDELEKRTDGRITAEHNPAGQLGNESDMLQQLNSGTIDIANITTAQLSNSSTAFGAWLMPHLVDTHQQAYELWNSEEGMALFETLENENVKGLGYSTSGFRYLLTTNPIESIQDLSGTKIRTTPSSALTDFWNSLDVSPTSMPLSEVYTSLQTNVIEGVDIDTESIVNENLTETATYMTPSKHIYWSAAIMINNDLWESLAEEDQLLIQQVVDEVTKNHVERITESEKDLLENGEEELGISIMDFDFSEFDPYVDSIRETWSEKSPYISDFLNKADSIKDN